MTVASTTNATNSTATSYSTKTKETNSENLVDYDAFLKIFMAELKNQDPTNPPDSSAFVAQLANFSIVEQSTKANAKLDTLMMLSTLSQADNLIGHTITSADGTTSGVVASLRATSSGAVAVLQSGKEVTLGEGVKIS
jgi:flagellar basal-body rod modification protein FlgD